MLFLSLISAALAMPSNGGIQVAMYPPGAEFAEDMIASQYFDVAEDLVSGEAGCYDLVGIRNLNAHIPINDAQIEFAQDAVTIDLAFDPIYGEDMVIFGEDDEWLDICPGFETNFNSFQITNARVRLTLEPSVDGDNVVLEVVGTPIVSGEISTDIDWIPDALILEFIENRIWSALSDKLAEIIPELVSEYLDTSLYAGQVGDLGINVDLTQVSVDSRAMVIGMDLAAEWDGESCLVMDAPQAPEGRNPQIDFGDGNGSALGLALTEKQLNGLLLGAYADGLLCFDYGPLAGALDAVGDSLEDPVENTEVIVEFGAPPILRIDPERMRLSLEDFHFAIAGDVEGASTEFIAIDANIDAAVELRVDPNISSIVLDVVYIDLQVEEFQADPILSDKAGAEERFLAFIEGWVLDVVASRIQEVPLYSSLFYAADTYIRLDTISTTNGGLLVQASLFKGDDLEVDLEAPDTEARILSVDTKEVTVEWTGTDNKNAPLSFSCRIDDGEWSTWSAEPTGSVPAPPPGKYILEVRARDGWHNVDPSPALLVFEVTAEEPKEEGCMCSASSKTPGLFGLLMLPLLWVRRRR